MLGDLQLETIKDKMCLMYMEYLGLRYRCVLYAVLYFDRLLCKARFFAYFARSIVRTKTAAYGGVRFFKGVGRYDLSCTKTSPLSHRCTALYAKNSGFYARYLYFCLPPCFSFYFRQIAVNDSSPRSLGID